jgi:anti-sigma B factor antagonist
LSRTPLDVTVTGDADGHTIVAPDGVLDFSSRHILQDRLTALLDEGHRYLILDLSGVPLCDSSGLSVFIQTHRRAHERGGWVRLAGARPIVRRVLEITNLDRMVAMYDTVSDARTADPAASGPAER